MLELPEAITMARQLTESAAGKTVDRVLPPSKLHKFCWFNGDPAEYEAKIIGQRLLSAEAFGIYAEMLFENGQRLCVNDGVNIRLLREKAAPKGYQLMLIFTDGTALAFTVAMYGGIVLHDGGYDNEYYLKSRCAVSPLTPDFSRVFDRALADAKPTLSAKAFLATEQRFPGVGNGVAQDILFFARIHPKRKIKTLDEGERAALRSCMVSVLEAMTAQGGRDTEKDLYGAAGGYQTSMSKNTLASGCPACGGVITKEAYLGGSVYYCAHCQPL